MAVKDFMTRKVVYISPDTTVAHAADLMREQGLHRLPVIENDKLVGLVTEGTIAEASPSKATSLSIFEMNYLLNKTKVKDVMIRDVVTVSGYASLEDATYLMLKNKIDHFTVGINDDVTFKSLEVKEKIGFVSSSLNTFSDSLNNQTLNNIVLSGKYNSIGIYQEITQKDREKANNIIKDFKLSHLKLNKYITLSQGEQRKTLLARAFMNEPSLLILDEPCSGLDIRAREIFLKTLEESKSDVPFIYVTHQIEEIIPSITHVAILDNGEIVSQGNKFEVLTEENLSKLYGIDLKIEWSNNRPWLIVK